MNTPGSRLKAARERAGYDSAKAAALAMGVPIATYTEHEKATTHLPARRADDYAKFFGITPEYLLYGRGPEPLDRLMVTDIYGRPTGQTVTLPPTPSSLSVALQDETFASFGFVAVYEPPQGGRLPTDCHGRLCVVLTHLEGNPYPVHLIRLVQRGSASNRFHLISPAATALPLIDHEVLWLAPVQALVPLPTGVA